MPLFSKPGTGGWNWIHASIAVAAIVVGAWVSLYAANRETGSNPVGTPSDSTVATVPAAPSTTSSSPAPPAPATTSSTRSTGGATPATGSGSLDGPPAAAAPEVRHHGPLILRNGDSNYLTDLDAPQSDSRWGRGSRTGDAAGDAPYILGSNVTTGRAGVPLKLMGSDNVDYAACADLGDVSGNSVAIGDLRSGSSMCLKTTAARWARLVVATDPSGDEVRLDVTVWERAR